jgi:hypothetical protein
MGVGSPIIGRTPVDQERDLRVFERYYGRAPRFSEPYPRGYEIQQWLDEHPYDGARSVVILDDDDDMEHLSNRHVRSSFERGGLLGTHAQQAVRLLNDPSL